MKKFKNLVTLMGIAASLRAQVPNPTQVRFRQIRRYFASRWCPEAQRPSTITIAMDRLQ